MQCKSDDCTNEAVAKVIFPWSAGEGETVVCQQHLEAARQLMTNLNRASELQVLPLVAPGVEVVPSTPAPVAVPAPAPGAAPAVAVARPTEERLTHQLRAQCLALELDLEKQRGARIAAELELVREIRTVFDHIAGTVKQFLTAEVPELVKQFKAAAAEATGEEVSVVDGPTTARLSPEPDQAPPDPPATEPEAPASPPGQDAPPHAP